MAEHETHPDSGAEPRSGADPGRRTEGAERARQADRRAAQAGFRAAELRQRQDEAAGPGTAHGPSPDDLATSRRHADDAADHLIEAAERAAVAHDRAALLYEQRAAVSDPDGDGPEGPGPGSTGPEGTGSGHSPGPDPKPGHRELAQEHRRAAAADREFARKAGRRRDAPAD